MSFRGQYAIPAGRLKVSNRELARGATGIVFPGRLKPAGLGPSERVSYKTLLPLHLPDLYGCEPGTVGRATFLEEFEREAILLSTLSHPSILRFRGVGLDEATGELKYIVTDLAECSLDGAVSEGPVSKWQLWRWMLEIAQGYAHMHSLSPPRFHRDIKPDNVLLFRCATGTLEAKVADFGLSKAAFEIQTNGQGAPYYRAPEMGQPGGYTPKVDVFSYGVMLAEVFLRAVPVEGDALPTLIPDPTNSRAAVFPDRFAMIDAAKRRAAACGWPLLAEVIAKCTAGTTRAEAEAERWSFAEAVEGLRAAEPTDLKCPQCPSRPAFGRDKEAKALPCRHLACSVCVGSVSGATLAPCKLCGVVSRKRDTSTAWDVMDEVERVNAPWAWLPPVRDDEKIVLVLMGRTGRGKSTTGCKLLGWNPKVWYKGDGSGDVCDDQTAAAAEAAAFAARPPSAARTEPAVGGAAGGAGAGEVGAEEGKEEVVVGPPPQLGFPFPSARGSAAVTSSVNVTNASFWLKAGVPGVDLTVVDTPGFGDRMGAVETSRIAPGVCANVCRVMSDPSIGGATAILFFVGSERLDTELHKELMLLQHFFGSDVWSRLMFVFWSESDDDGTRAGCADIVNDAMAAVSVKIDREIDEANVWRYPVLLAADDSPEVVLGKVRWALHKNKIPLGGRMPFTFAPTSCVKCSASTDARLLEALSAEYGYAFGGSEGRCHPGFEDVLVPAEVEGRLWMGTFGVPLFLTLGVIADIYQSYTYVLTWGKAGFEDKGLLETDRSDEAGQRFALADASKLLWRTVVDGIQRYDRQCCTNTECRRKCTTAGCTPLSDTVTHEWR